MSVEQVRIELLGDSPGRVTELNYYRLGPEDADKKVYLQAAIHANEQPGILMFGKIAIVLFLLAIIYTLVSSFWFLIREKGEGTHTVRRLTWRIGLSMMLFVLLYLAYLAGWLHPGSGNPVQYSSA